MFDTFYIPVLFVFGTIIGSYLNVLGLRYSTKNGFRESNKGRSHCPHCDSTLTWKELIPVISFFILRGKCKSCHKKLSLQYPLVELLTGSLFILVPSVLGFSVPALIWLVAFLVFIVLSIVDFRLNLIPNELNILIAILGVTLIGYYFITNTFGLHGADVNGSFLGSYAITFWLVDANIFINYLTGLAVGMFSFGSIYAVTKGRGMGFGDVKLASALGLLLGWPDIVLALALAFLTGAISGSVLMLTRKKKLKSSLPFGPFIVLGVTLVFFFGYDILSSYFSLFNVF